MTKTTDSAEDYAGYITYRISQLNARMIAQGRQILREQCDLGVVQWRIMRLVASSANPVTSTFITQSIAMDPGQFSRNLKALIDQGLIESKQDKTDNRKQMLKLTKRGRERYNKAAPVMKERREAIMRGISDADARVFFRALETIENNLKNSLTEETHA